jgi:hypothetical protein
VKALLTLYEGSVSALSAPSSPLRVPDSLLSHCILMQEKGQYDLHLYMLLATSNMLVANSILPPFKRWQYVRYF